MNTTEQALKQSIKDIETVLRIEGMDLEIGSRKLLREVISALTAASAEAQPSQEPVGYLVECLSEEIPSTLWKHPFGEDRDGKWRNTPLYPHPQPSAPVAQATGDHDFPVDLVERVRKACTRMGIATSESLEECSFKLDTLLYSLCSSIERHYEKVVSSGTQTQPVSEQNARHAIDGAIEYGRNGINPPPSTDHWLMPYWEIGRALSTAPQVEQVEAKEGWISVKDRLPERHQVVALVDEDRWRNTGGEFDLNVHACGYLAWSGNAEYWSCFGESRGLVLDAFTHWHALPAAPSSQKEGEQPK